MAYSNNITFDSNDTLKNRDYKDVALTMFQHPMSRDVGKKSAASAVKQAIESILRTNKFERPFQPELGCDILKLLFEPMNPITEIRIKQVVSAALMRSEPRADIQDITVTGQEEMNRYVVRIIFTLNSSPAPEKMDVILERKS